MKAQLLLLMFLSAYAQTENYGLVKADWSACIYDLESIATNWAHAVIDWMTIVGFPHALQRMGAMLDSLGYAFQHCFGINIPEPFGGLFSSYNDFVSQDDLFSVPEGQNAVLFSGVDLTASIAAYEWETEFDQSGERGYHDCLEAIEGVLKAASVAIQGMTSGNAEHMVHPVATVLAKTKVVIEHCLSESD